MKICTKCKETKELSGFYKDKAKKDGLEPCCKVCRNTYKKAWREANKEWEAINNKTYYQENKEQINIRNKAYYQDNKEQLQAKSKAWAQANQDKKNAHSAKYRSAKLQRTPSWLTAEDWNKINNIYSLAALMTQQTGTKHEVDHIIPLQGCTVSGLHTPNNLQILTKSDNCAKGNTISVPLGDSNE